MRKPGRIELVGEWTNQRDGWDLDGSCFGLDESDEEPLGYRNDDDARWMFGVGLEMIKNRAIRIGGGMMKTLWLLCESECVCACVGYVRVGVRPTSGSASLTSGSVFVASRTSQVE